MPKPRGKSRSGVLEEHWRGQGGCVEGIIRKQKDSGIPWQSSGLNSAFPMQEAQVLFLAGKLRSRTLHNKAKKKKKEREREESKTELVSQSQWIQSFATTFTFDAV